MSHKALCTCAYTLGNSQQLAEVGQLFCRTQGKAEILVPVLYIRILAVRTVSVIQTVGFNQSEKCKWYLLHLSRFLSRILGLSFRICNSLGISRIVIGTDKIFLHF